MACDIFVEPKTEEGGVLSFFGAIARSAEVAVELRSRERGAKKAIEGLVSKKIAVVASARNVRGTEDASSARPHLYRGRENVQRPFYPCSHMQVEGARKGIGDFPPPFSAAQTSASFATPVTKSTYFMKPLLSRSVSSGEQTKQHHETRPSTNPRSDRMRTEGWRFRERSQGRRPSKEGRRPRWATVGDATFGRRPKAHGPRKKAKGREVQASTDRAFAQIAKACSRSTKTPRRGAPERSLSGGFARKTETGLASDDVRGRSHKAECESSCNPLRDVKIQVGPENILGI
jgi:hypothetical protein